MTKKNKLEKALEYSNTIFNSIIIFILISGTIIWADTNGIWHFPEDIRPGTFGTDEGANLSNNYTFLPDIYFNSTIILKNMPDCAIGTDSNNKLNCDPNFLALLNCHKQGLLLGDGECIYPMGIDITPSTYIFNNLTDLEINTIVNSNTIKLTGFVKEISATIKGDSTAYFDINGINKGQTTTISPNDNVTLKIKSSNDYETTKWVNVTIGRNKFVWNVETKSDIITSYSLTSCEKYINGIISNEDCTTTWNILENSGYFCGYEGRSSCCATFRNKFIHEDGTIVWSAPLSGGYGNWPSECVNWGNTMYQPTWIGYDPDCITSENEICNMGVY